MRADWLVVLIAPILLIANFAFGEGDISQVTEGTSKELASSDQAVERLYQNTNDGGLYPV
jgi:hypothetical protein